VLTVRTDVTVDVYNKIFLYKRQILNLSKQQLLSNENKIKYFWGQKVSKYMLTFSFTRENRLRLGFGKIFLPPGLFMTIDVSMKTTP
jgi:hypothetical protein